MEHKIELIEYAARTETPFCLGTAESYGVERLRFVRGMGWENLELAATFHPPRGADPVQVRIDAEDAADVPPEATAVGGVGELIVIGYQDGVRRCSCGVRYRVDNHAPVGGDPPADLTPSLTQQILAAANSAEKTAQSVRDDADSGKFIGPPGPKGDAGTAETLSNLEIQEIINML
ncbi:hypothetical protein [uncultured Gemmiger sp.]|uniref:hypothetical protein n=1 Tax=uncultured Gemmiger sp. TaxID=1623490 RepID=UPI0025E98296|nr:hypothetical protein [uncultured Gemmiger sp.]